MIKDIEKEILSILHNNIGERALTSRQIFKEISDKHDITAREVEFHLDNLKEMNLVRFKKTNSPKIAGSSFPAVVTFEISSKGVNLVENDYIVKDSSSHSLPSTVIYGGNVNLGQINNIYMNINIVETINQIAATEAIKDEIKKIANEISIELENEKIEKSKVKTLFGKVAEKGFDKLTEALIAYIGSKLLGM